MAKVVNTKTGETMNLTDEGAKNLVKNSEVWALIRESGEAKEVEKLGEAHEGSEEGDETKGPLWRRRIPISEQRNLQVVVWSGKEDRSPSLCLEEGKKDDDGNWQNNRIYLSVAKAWEIAERISDGAKFIRDRGES